MYSNIVKDTIVRILLAIILGSLGKKHTHMGKE